MDTASFRKTYLEISGERSNLIGRRTDLETELSETRNKIAHLDEILDHLSPLIGIPARNDSLHSLGLTDAIRAVIHIDSERFTPTDVRERLQERGYDLSDLTAPMASIYKVLSRLADDPDERLTREKEEGRVYYRFAGISDEDIPF